MSVLSLQLIADAKEIPLIAEKLSAAQFIAFDTEFIRESTFYPKLEILQIAQVEEA